MASICRDPNGRKRILFVDVDGSRKTLRLGKIDLKTAQTIKRHVEALLVAKITNTPAPQDTATWLAGIGHELKQKLASAGLIHGGKLLRDLVEAYVQAKRATIKPQTLHNNLQAMKYIMAILGEATPIESIKVEDAERIRRILADQGYRPMTVARRLAVAREIFNYAVQMDWLTKNPFAYVRHPVPSTRDRQHYVSIEETQRLLEAAPDWQWRTIIGLCRFAGLRCPSEVFALQWQDVNLPDGIMWVRSPKTEHHRGHEGRWVPIFDPLKPLLEEAWDCAVEEQVHVLPRETEHGTALSRLSRPTLHDRFKVIVKRAGLTPWPRLFHNLRSSCETDLALRYPLHLASRWLGNSTIVANRHYLQAGLNDHLRYAGDNPFAGGAKSGARAAQNAAQHEDD